MRLDELPAKALARCSSCSAQVVYALTERGKLMPVDAEPARGGTYLLTVGTDGAVRARAVVAKLAFGRSDLHRSHFATCPDAATYSGRARSRRGRFSP